MVAIFFVHDVCWRGWRWPCSCMCCSGGGHVLTFFQPMGGELTTPKQHRKSDEKETPAENLIKPSQKNHATRVH